MVHWGSSCTFFLSPCHTYVCSVYYKQETRRLSIPIEVVKPEVRRRFVWSGSLEWLRLAGLLLVAPVMIVGTAMLSAAMPPPEEDL